MVIMGFHPPVEKACALPPAALENVQLTLPFRGSGAPSPAVAPHCQCPAQEGQHFCKHGCLPSSKAGGDSFSQPANCD